MAPKKAKKAADNINSRLALVMKSGKGKPLIGASAEQLAKSAPSHIGLQVNSQIPTIWQGQARYHCRQYSTSTQKRARVLLHAGKVQRTPFRWKQCK